MRNDDRELAHALAEKVAAAGGRAYFVGGMVRDELRGEGGKDVDMEVYGLTPDALRALAATLGEVVEKGASFGVLGLKHSDIDIAMPRTEKCVGTAHRDFEVTVDPFLPPERASLRRDFTMNAMMRDALTGEILDFHGGREDLKNGRIRMVCARTFAEDSLRVFRAAQFAARFEAEIEPETRALCAQMDVSALSHERVYEELCKALMKAKRPSVFFRELRAMGHLKEFFPELLACADVSQNPRFHPEGDVFEHTMLVVDEAALLRERALKPLWFMLAALLHDLGKLVATRVQADGRITAYGHEVLGLALVETQLRRLTNNLALIRYVLNMVQLHMRPNMLAGAHSHKKKTRALFDLSLCPEDLILLSRADASGKKDEPYNESNEVFLRERLADYRAVMQRPMVTGKDLIAAGLTPDTHFADYLKRAKVLHFGGMEKRAALRQIVAEANRRNAPLNK